MTILREKYNNEMKEPTLMLQSVFRQLRTQQLVKHDYFVRKLREKLISHIVKVQAHVRKRQAKRRTRYYKLVRVILNARIEAAIIIQKHYKRYVTRHLYEKVVELERNYISLKWLPSCTSQASFNNVEVIGSFTNPPWGKRVELDFCPLRGIFVKYINNITEGTYLIKFIVNGEFKCDEHLLPIATDPSGHTNNVLEIGYDNESQSSGSLNSSERRRVLRQASSSKSLGSYPRLNKHNLKILD